MFRTVFCVVFGLAEISYGGMSPPALFGRVTGVAENDTLNIRAKPEYRSEKRGELLPGAAVGIEKCLKRGRSLWCLAHPDPLMNDSAPGWVNARFLSFFDRGYVNISGRKNGCYYALRCKKDGNCLVVTDLLGKSRIIGLKKEWIERGKLIPTNNFGAMPPDEGGYCTTRRYIDSYLAREKVKKSGKIFRDPAFDTAAEALYAIADRNIIALSNIVHPKKGVVLSDQPVFALTTLSFSRGSLVEKYDKGNELSWGIRGGSGSAIRKNLWNYMDDMLPHLGGLSKIEKENADMHHFDRRKRGELRGYEFFWTDSDSETKDHNWRGVVIILEKYGERWYVVGILRDYWSI